MAVRIKLLPASYGVEVIEAIAIEEWILLAREMMLSQVIVVSDSIVVVQAINSNSLHRDLGPIIQGILALLGLFGCWKVKHLKRDYKQSGS